MNDTRTTAQTLDGSFSDQSSNPNIFRNATNDPARPVSPSVTINGRISTTTDVDFFSFTTTMANATAFFDTDTAGLTGRLGDSFLSLFDPSGTLIALGDDISRNGQPRDPGNATSVNSFIGVVTPGSPGSYTIAVSDFRRTPTALASGTPTRLTRPDGVTDEGSSVDDDNVLVTGATAGDSSFSGTGGFGNNTINVSVGSSVAVVPAPEPGTMSLRAIGLASLGAASRKPQAQKEDAGRN